jgi:thiol-disulfide isomerase/thioredoxin
MPMAAAVVRRVVTGTVILLLALLGAGGFALHRARVDGRFAPSSEVEEGRPSEVEEGRLAARHETGANPSEVEEGRPSEVEEGRLAARHETGTSPDTPLLAAVGAERLGDRATLVQFSSAFCAPCRTTRVLLADVAEREDGVTHVEVDAEQHLELVRALDVRRTPTTLILDRAGREVVRAAGAPRRHQVLAALPASPMVEVRRPSRPEPFETPARPSRAPQEPPRNHPRHP